MSSQTSHVKIKFTSDANDVYTEFNGMSEKTQALGIKLSGLASNFKQLDSWVDDSAKGFESFGSKSNKYITSLETKLANLSLSAKDLAQQQAKLNAMKFGASADDIRRAGELAAKIYDISNASKNSIDTLSGLNRAFANITHWAGALNIFGASLDAIPSKLLESVQAFESVNGSISFFAKSQSELAEINTYIGATAEKMNVSIVTYAQSYTRMLTLQDAGIITQQRSRDIMEGMTNAAAALGASNVQLDQSMYGLAQGLSAGILRMEELNQVTEPLPGLLNQLDLAAGLPAGGVRKLVNEGKVTSDFFSQTLVKALDAYAGAAEAKTNTIAAASTRLENAWYKMGEQLQQPVTSVAVAGLDSMSSAVSALGNGLSFVSNHTNDMKIAFIGAGSAMVAYTAYTGALSVAMGTAATTAGALGAALVAIARHPVAIALAGAATAVAAFGGESDKADVDVRALSDSVNTVVGNLDKIKASQADKALSDIKTAVAELTRQIEEKSLWDVMFGDADAMRATTQSLIQQRRELIERQKELTAHIEKSSSAQAAFNTVSSDTKSGQESIAKLQEQYALLTLSARDAAIAKAALEAASKGYSAEETDYIKQQAAAIFDLSEQNKAATTAVKSFSQAQKDSEKSAKESEDALKKQLDVIKDAQSVLNKYLETDFDKQLKQITELEAAWAKLYKNGLAGQQEFADALYNMDLQQFPDAQVAGIDKVEKRYDQFYSKFSKINDPIIDSFGALLDATSDYFKNYESLRDGIAAGDLKAIEVNERNQLTMYSNIAGAMSTMFKDGSKEQKAMFEIQKAITLATLALDAQKLASTLGLISVKTTEATVAGTAAVLTQGSGDPYSAWVRMAAMAATVGALLSAIGGTSPAISSSAPAAIGGNGADSPVGSADHSQSLANSIDYMQNVSANQYTELKKIYTELQDLNSNITGIVSSLYVSGDVKNIGANVTTKTSSLGADYANFVKSNPVTQFAYDLPVVGGVLEALDGIAVGVASGLINGIFGDTEIYSRAAGLTVEAFQLGMESQLKSYVDMVKDHDPGWGRSTEYTYWTDYADITGAANDQFKKLFTSLRDGMVEVGISLDRNVTEQVNAFVIDIGKIQTSGKTGAEIELALQEAISGQADKLAYAIFPDIVTKYAQLNEGYFEALTRIVTDKAVVESTLGDVGIKIEGDVIAISQSLVKLSGSISDFASNTQSFIDAFYSDAQKAELTTQSVTKLFESISMTAPTSRAALVDLVRGLDLTTASGQQAYVAITSSATLLDQYYKVVGESTPVIDERTAALQRQREEEQKLVDAIKTWEDANQSFLDMRNSLLDAGKAADAMALSMDRFFTNPLTNPYEQDGSFNAANWNYQIVKEQAKAAKEMTSYLSINALKVQNVQDSLAAFDVGQFAGAYSPLVTPIYIGLRDGIAAAAGDVGYVIRDAIDSSILTYAQQSVISQYTSTASGIASVMAAGARLSSASSYASVNGMQQYGEDVIAYGNAINNLDAAFESGRINSDQYAKSVESINNVFGEVKDLLNNQEAQLERMARLQFEYANAGVESIRYYFDSLSNIVSGLAKAAEETSSAVSLATKSIGELNSMAYVLTVSANAASSQSEVADKNAALIATSKTVAEYAQKASDIITTVDAKSVQQVLEESDLFKLLASNDMRGFAMLLDGIKTMDAATYQNAFYKLSDALVKGAVSVDQYSALFDIATQMYNGDDILAGIKAQEQATIAAADALNALKEAAKSLSDSLLINQQTTYLDPVARFDELNRQYLMAVDNRDSQALSSLVNDYLAAAKDAAKSQLDYNLIAAQTIVDLKRVESSGASNGLPVPAFASGGYHAGGIRLVGENGPELEATGASRIFNAQQTQSILRGGSSNNDALVKQLIDEVSMLREENKQLLIEIKNNGKRTAEKLEKFDAVGMPTVVSV